MTATETIPPARPAIIYPNISGIPCNKYLEKANVPENNKPFDAAKLLVNVPIAAAMTVAFHVNINIAPAP